MGWEATKKKQHHATQFATLLHMYQGSGIQRLYWLNVYCTNVCLQCDVMVPMGSRFNCEVTSLGSSFSLMCELLCLGLSVSERLRLCAPSHHVGHPYNCLVFVRACIFVCVQSEVVLSCTCQVQQKHVFMFLQLICIALMGTWCPTDCVWCSRSGHPDKFVFTIGARLCVLPFSPSYADFLSQSCLCVLSFMCS